MTVARFERWLAAYGAAWVERDPEAAGALFAEGAAYHETPFAPPQRGREAIRGYWQAVPRGQQDVSFRWQLLAVAGEQGCARWQAAFTRLPSGRRVELDGVLVARFDAAGECVELREWWHRREPAG